MIGAVAALRNLFGGEVEITVLLTEPETGDTLSLSSMAPSRVHEVLVRYVEHLGERDTETRQ
jgi:hypothetical protein